jgi:hypothetical protein
VPPSDEKRYFFLAVQIFCLLFVGPSDPAVLHARIDVIVAPRNYVANCGHLLGEFWALLLEAAVGGFLVLEVGCGAVLGRGVGVGAHRLEGSVIND